MNKWFKLALVAAVSIVVLNLLVSFTGALSPYGYGGMMGPGYGHHMGGGMMMRGW